MRGYCRIGPLAVPRKKGLSTSTLEPSQATLRLGDDVLRDPFVDQSLVLQNGFFALAKPLESLGNSKHRSATGKGLNGHFARAAIIVQSLLEVLFGNRSVDVPLL